MKSVLHPILTVIVTLCLLGPSGCRGVPSTGQPAPLTGTTAIPVTSVTHTQVVSFRATPIRYAEVDGVRLGYREFGSAEPHPHPAPGNSPTSMFFLLFDLPACSKIMIVHCHVMGIRWDHPDDPNGSTGP